MLISGDVIDSLDDTSTYTILVHYTHLHNNHKNHVRKGKIKTHFYSFNITF